MPAINSCTIAGHAAADAELRHLQGGNAVCEIRMAITSGFGDNKKTIWTKAVIWGKPAEWMATCQKGDTVVLQNAEFCVDEWDGKDGSKQKTHYFSCGRQSACFYVKKGHFKEQAALEPMDSPKTPPTSNGTVPRQAPAAAGSDDNLPF